jgi:aspartyl/glutamyl-tRNA(Asn/Gln) amidotransferase C subunit
LKLDAKERERLTRDCQAILGYFETIRRVDAEAAESAAALERAARLREDRVGSDPLERPPAEIAPAWREGYFVVPRLPAMDADGGTGEEA